MAFTAKFPSACEKCGGHIPAGAPANFNPDTRKLRHAPRCPKPGSAPLPMPAAPQKRDEAVTDDTKIVGRATYKGKTGYLILWMGTTSRGEAAKLAFRDGSKVFWADLSEVTVEKLYEDREYRGRPQGGMTFGRLNRLAKEFAEEKATEAKAAAEALQAQADRAAARAAKAKAEGKTLSEVIADEQATATEARKGLRDFTRSDKNSVTVGERTKTTAKDGTVHHYEVVSVGKSYYHSEDDCEDMDCFCGHYEWKTPFTAREIAATPDQLAAEARKVADAEERKTLETAIRGSYSADTHLGSSAPEGVTMTNIWSDSRMAGSESWYLGSDGIVYHMRSDYDMGPSWWRTSAAPEQIERAKALGMKAVY